MIERFEVKRDLPSLLPQANRDDILGWQIDSFGVLVKEFFELVKKTNELIDRMNQQEKRGEIT